MKKISFKALLPHIIAFFVFLLLSIIFTQPALEGKVVEQHDVQQWKAMAQQSFEFKAKYGYYPRWTNSMFSGMPAYQIAVSGKPGGFQVFFGSIETFFTLGLPKPVYFLLIACMCFYFFCIVIGVNPWLSILGGIAYGYCSYNVILIAVGHDTKLLSMAFAPAVFASVFLIFDKKYWLGSALLLIFTTCLLMQNHQQIVYYTMIMMSLIMLYLIIKCIKQKDYKHLLLSVVLSISMAVISLLVCSGTYFATYEYSKESMRGGSAIATTGNKENTSKNGLDKDYAFSWSYGKAETFTLITPNAFGGGSSTSLGDDSKVLELLQQTPNLPGQMAQELYQAATAYWGEQPSTSGPVYFGAIVCLLFLLGTVLVKSEHKWWILAITVVGILLAWGKNFPTLNYFLFDHFPFYNKFRTPAMALVMPQFAMPLLGVLFLNELIAITDKEKLTAIAKKILIITAVVVIVLLGFYFFADFKNEATEELRKSLSNAMQGSDNNFTRDYISALVKDRQSLYMADMWRSIGFIAAAIAVIYLFTRKIIKPVILYVALILLTTVDLVSVGKRYLSSDNFIDPTDYESAYADYNADIQIKRDPGFFRVMNLAFPGGNGNFQVSIDEAFNDAIASYKHNTIGGYHPAKLSIYQDLIQNQIRKNIQAWAANPNAKDSFKVLNMLNMRYVIIPDRNNPKQTTAIINPYAMGNCWLVKDIQYVNSPDEEMNMLDSIDPAKTVLINQEFKPDVPFEPVYDSLAYIKLIENKNDEITYDFNSSTNQFAVFSEIYYKEGWEAYIDDKRSNYCKVDYALRGMAIPAGKHTIKFVFDSKVMDESENLTRYASIFSFLFLALSAFMIWKKNQKKPD